MLLVDDHSDQQQSVMDPKDLLDLRLRHLADSLT